MKTGRKYSQELKRRVAHCYYSSDLSMSAVAKKFGIGTTSVERWSRKFRSEFAPEMQLRQEITKNEQVATTATQLCNPCNSFVG